MGKKDRLIFLPNEQTQIMRKFINKSQLTYDEYEKHYGLTEHTINAIRNTKKYKQVVIYKSQQSTIFNLVRRPLLLERVAVTDRLLSKINKLIKIYVYHYKVAELLKITRGKLSTILCHATKTVDYALKNRIDKLYKDSQGYVYIDEKELASYVDIKAIVLRDKLKALRRNRAKMKPLTYGKTYKIYHKDKKGKKLLEEYGTVIGEYEHYYLIDCGRYKSTVLKNVLIEKYTVVEEVV